MRAASCESYLMWAERVDSDGVDGAFLVAVVVEVGLQHWIESTLLVTDANDLFIVRCSLGALSQIEQATDSVLSTTVEFVPITRHQAYAMSATSMTIDTLGISGQQVSENHSSICSAGDLFVI